MNQSGTRPRGTELSRFNALRHGALSRYTVLPWEDGAEYAAIVAALTAEHNPQGPTEEHLVEELAGIIWRKRRLRGRCAPSRAPGGAAALSRDGESGSCPRGRPPFRTRCRCSSRVGSNRG